MFCLDILFEIIKDVVLSELEPKEIDIWVIRIILFDGPPRPIISKDSLDQSTIVSLTTIQDIIILFLSNINSQVI